MEQQAAATRPPTSPMDAAARDRTNDATEGNSQLRAATAAAGMKRGVKEGRYRLRENHHAHSLAIKKYGCTPDNIFVIGEGRWKAIDDVATYHISERTCICDPKINNHCQRDNCNVCPYAYLCDCKDNSKAGICCPHIHAVSLFASEGKLKNEDECTHFEEEPIEEDDERLFPELFLKDKNNNTMSTLQKLERNKDAIQELEMCFAELRCSAVMIAKNTTEEASSFLSKCIEIAGQLHDEARKLLRTTRQHLPKRADVPAVGRPPNTLPIRLQGRSALRQRKERSSGISFESPI
ncbi:hypothetical protein Q1695_012098 [Nippostrongylus brasiliensis]|nr:hypothetical protein Q1695_012098 [Nippostrongylus brasiliensis]